MSPEKEKQKNQFKKKKKKRRKIKNMKGMITSFIIAFLIVSMLAIFVYSLNPVFSDENTIPVSGTVISVTGETRRNRYQRKPWVIIELDNGEKYEIAGGLLKKSGWDMKELQNQILYKKVTVRYPKEKIASLFSINYGLTFLSMDGETIIDYTVFNQERNYYNIALVFIYVCILSFTEFCIWVTYGKYRVG